jgi:hypothetical protein
MHFFAQVNTSITELNLEENKLDAEAGKALGKALDVRPIFIVITLQLVFEVLSVQREQRAFNESFYLDRFFRPKE